LFMIAFGYDVRDSQIAGPDWLGTERFAVEAPMPHFCGLQSIGLKLDKTKTALPVIVIDHAEKKPVEN
jgi:hypothetical protein